MKPRTDRTADESRDERLTALLSEWKGIEPRGTFHAAVWRRIRVASAAESRGLSLIATVRERMLPKPAWATAMAVIVAVFIGLWAGFSGPAPRYANQAGQPLLNRQTLAGSYLAMVEGEAR
jgi:hypothetical protein